MSDRDSVLARLTAEDTVQQKAPPVAERSAPELTFSERIEMKAGRAAAARSVISEDSMELSVLADLGCQAARDALAHVLAHWQGVYEKTVTDPEVNTLTHLRTVVREAAKRDGYAGGSVAARLWRAGKDKWSELTDAEKT